MGLSVNQIRAADLVAQGAKDRSIWTTLSISEATYYRWKRLDSFQECVGLFQAEKVKRAALLTTSADSADLDECFDSEKKVSEKIGDLVLSLLALTNSLVEKVIEDGPENLSPRLIPSLTKAVTDSVSCLRLGHDRALGLEGLLSELSQLEQEMIVKGIEIK